MESVNNKSFTPLQAGRAYIGIYDKVDAYSSAVISLVADQNCLITMYQSQNRTLEYSTTYNYTTAGAQYTQSVPLTAPYVYFTVRNESSTDQTRMNFTVIYKTAYPVSGGGGGGDVNIFDSSGANIDSDGSGNLNVKLNTVNPSFLQDNGLKTYIVNSSLPITLSTQRKTQKVWNLASITNGATAAEFDVSNISATNLSVYGTTIVAGGTDKISVMFSGDNVNYYESQYYVDVTGGSFGFSLPVSAPYARLLYTGSLGITITAVMSAS